MTYDEAESKTTQLAFAEKCYILMALALEEKADKSRQEAEEYREKASALLEQQSKIWQELSES